MELTAGILMTVEDKKYIILETITYKNEKYAFANEVKGEEDLTEDYYIFKILGNEIKLTTNEELLNTLLPIFQEKLKETIKRELKI